ncbi:MAG: VWA-like domain-containing protein [Pseudomonadota bacterium]
MAKSVGKKGGGGGRLAAFQKNRKAIEAGQALAGRHPFIAPLPPLTVTIDAAALELPKLSWARLVCEHPAAEPWWAPPSGSGYSSVAVHSGGAPAARPRRPEWSARVWPNLRRRAEAEEWAHIFARMRLHLALSHVDPTKAGRREWDWACWVRAEEMAAAARVGRRPAELPAVPQGLPRGAEAILATHFEAHGAPEEVRALSLGAPGEPFWRCAEGLALDADLREQRLSQLAEGARRAATDAIQEAGGLKPGRADGEEGVAAQARAAILQELPLLAALAASFAIVEDAELCARLDIAVAAISDAAQEIYFNPNAGLSPHEARFVMAHELLHAGLRHTPRRQGRDPWLWNVACDYVINGWLIEMRIGAPPERLGYLHDPDLQGLSAEEIYDRIVRDLRWMRRLRKERTFNGAAPDMLEDGRPASWWRGGGADLDAFYRRALAEGLDLQLKSDRRGLLPLGLVEEIRALQQPPIPWDVALGQWLDQYFPPVERRRSFARAHRRQSATPDIARPAWITPEEARAARVFGAVLDTSGSMDRVDLGKAVGALASYGMSRDVTAVRLIQCDAAAHDAGYVAPDALLDRVEVRGRGGTTLGPGLRLLERADDFPKDAPVLILTDGACDRLQPRREHAYLLTEYGRLPFSPTGPVFRVI